MVHERTDVIPLLAEIFRDLGYEGATLSRITERTGLGKGSLYHFFPGGKEDMAAVVLADVDAWFERSVFQPLRLEEPQRAIPAMWEAVDAYFHSGQRICLVGAFALDETRDRFSATIRGYFGRWIEALQDALLRAGRDKETAARDAEETVLAIQGALVLSRATGDEGLFARTLDRLRLRVAAA
ncbi:TetR/AcrR family transcriptional regulator [Pseudaminobacter arsenicus]|uniref:TetR/AcrR family transcriptional regulator n=1 Tax=Borborobacter arsenicus TaxID=1851146 RepID=A0A432V1P2_9HYPH|nr:TetR/AcrR family transcriptional regulator [Pseudaminobacter arsenicus]RUM96113.1 TetR/AcrR family transcriptional regulator [Pseudaminobacter arsenicus]